MIEQPLDPFEPEELMGKDLITQRLRQGQGEMAEMGVMVVCNLRGYFYSFLEKRRLSDEAFEEVRDQTFQIGEGDAVPGLELALRHSRKGEVIKVTIASKFGYGYLGRCYAPADDNNNNSKLILSENMEPILVAKPTKNGPVPIPPNTDLEYEIEIVDQLPEGYIAPNIVSKMEKELQSCGDDEHQKNGIVHRYHTLQSMAARKDAGNRWFSYLDYARAARAYSKATQVAQSYFNPETEKKQTVGETLEDTAQRIEQQEREKEKPVDQDDKDLVEVYVACLNNLAACKLSMKDYGATKDLCVQVLQFSPFNAKALLRAAKATLALDAYEECEACLKRVFSIPDLDESTKTAAKLEQQRLRKAVADYKARSKEMQKNIATKLFAQQQKAASVKTVKESSPDLLPSSAKSTAAGEELSESKPIAATTNSEPNDHQATMSSSASTNTKAETKKPANNLMILVGTSLAIIVISIVCAYYYPQ